MRTPTTTDDELRRSRDSGPSADATSPTTNSFPSIAMPHNHHHHHQIAKRTHNQSVNHQDSHLTRVMSCIFRRCIFGLTIAIILVASEARTVSQNFHERSHFMRPFSKFAAENRVPQDDRPPSLLQQQLELPEDDSESRDTTAEDSPDRDARDLELDSVHTSGDDSIDTALVQHRMPKDESSTEVVVKGETPRRDSLYSYSVHNSTEKIAAARHVFASLRTADHKKNVVVARAHSDETYTNSIKYDEASNVLHALRPAHKARKKKTGGGNHSPELEKIASRNEALRAAVENNKEQVCRMYKYKQRIRIPGCLTKIVVNRLCSGTCTSFFVPRARASRLKPVPPRTKASANRTVRGVHKRQLQASFQSCSMCMVREYEPVEITLDCPGSSTPYANQTVHLVKRCECMNVKIEL